MLVINAFSANMLLNVRAAVSVRFEPISLEVAEDIIRFDAGPLVSAVGHAETAAIFSTLLGLPVPFARSTVQLRPGDRAILGQYKGPRLPEGATTLPEGAAIEWFAISVS